MRIVFHKDRFKEVKDKLKPTTSLWALFGIIFFFFTPEIVAFFWADEVKSYFIKLSHLYQDPLIQKVYIKVGESLSENSILNILLGLGFIWWWYFERKKSSQK